MFKQRFGKYLIFLLPLLILIIFTLLLVAIKKKLPTSTTLSPGQIPTPTPAEFFLPSRWATDAGVLQIEIGLSELEDKLKTVDLQEVQLQPPILDIEVKL